MLAWAVGDRRQATVSDDSAKGPVSTGPFVISAIALSPMSDDAKPLSPLWYLAALALALVGWNVGVAVAGGAWDQVRAAPITSANQPLAAEGSSVAVFSDAMQADLGIRCIWRTDRAWHRMPAAPVPLTVDDDGLTWQLVAFEIAGHDDMQVRCHTTRGRTEHAQFATAVVDGFTHRAMTGNLITLASVAIAGVGAGVIFLIRRRRLNA